VTWLAAGYLGFAMLALDAACWAAWTAFSDKRDADGSQVFLGVFAIALLGVVAGALCGAYSVFYPAPHP
jgi:hypothetical protein